jgi:hypothetical protein
LQRAVPLAPLPVVARSPLTDCDLGPGTFTLACRRPWRRPTVLLLAGDIRDEWKRALEAAGLEVITTGWLDAVTAARLHHPRVVVVSADLPANAPGS